MGHPPAGSRSTLISPEAAGIRKRLSPRNLLWALLLMIEILHDFVYQSLGTDGSSVYVGSCRISIINSSMGPYLLKRDLNYGPLFWRWFVMVL